MLRAITNTLATLTAGSVFAVSVVTVGFYLSPEAVRAAEPDPFQTQFRAQTIEAMQSAYPVLTPYTESKAQPKPESSPKLPAN
ncbi:hypothetical protein [Ruegeria arenilitoris]|uniref:hypothetical protein n=1 Tax=Ruegeria arenilitoris TaxID=1173585 RepID=UPI00157FD5DF|nr:hypothetical protein [Ruegeria arenilitoris]